MNVLGLIPARGGSKRLPRKNVMNLGGAPLIAWTIAEALKSKCLTHLMVSTDSIEIANVSKQFGASVPWLRPEELATDSASSVDVAIHALDRYEESFGVCDCLVLLQPTSPFRRSESIKEAMELFVMNNCRFPVVSFGPSRSHPAWCFKLNGDKLVPFVVSSDRNARSQDLEASWSLNGSIYIISPAILRAEKKFVTDDALPYVMSNECESIDIDTEFDFTCCEAYLRRLQDSECPHPLIN